MHIDAVQQGSWSFVLDEPTRVLIVDDDPILLEFATVHLSSPKAMIETAVDGATAWSMLSREHFDIVLLDIVMPGPDGFSLLEKIRAEPKLRHIPVVMLTGHEDIASIDKAYSLGANSFVAKPVNWRLLSYHMRCVLRSSHLARELREARYQAETKEASCNRMLLAFEVECWNVLRAIVRDAERCRDAGGSSAETAVRRIETLASDALKRWGQSTDDTIPAAGAAVAQGEPAAA